MMLKVQRYGFDSHDREYFLVKDDIDININAINTITHLGKRDVRRGQIRCEKRISRIEFNNPKLTIMVDDGAVSEIKTEWKNK